MSSGSEQAAFVNSFLELTGCRLSSEPGSSTWSVEFSGRRSLLSGHYPGNPIIPGIFTVEVCRIVAIESFSSLGTLSLIDFARFTHQLLPDDVLQVAVKQYESSSGLKSVNCVVRTNGKIAARLTLSFTQTGRQATTEASYGCPIPSDAVWVNPQDLIPHRGEMLMVDSVSVISDISGAGNFKVPRHHWATGRAGTYTLPHLVILESWCQSAAALVSKVSADTMFSPEVDLLFIGMEHVRLHSGRVRPGDVVAHSCSIDQVVDGRFASVRGSSDSAGQGRLLTVGLVSIAARGRTEG